VDQEGEFGDTGGESLHRVVRNAMKKGLLQ
jgi:hypothetical protein